MNAPVLVLKDALKRESGNKVHHANIQASKAVADIIRTTLGPRSMLKMLLDAGGGIVVTNDGNAILRELDVAHPAAKSMIELSRTQDEEVGDGTTSVIVLAGEMLHVAEAFIDKNYHPTVICRAYNKALEDAVSVLDKIALTVDAKDRSTMLGLVKSCIGTKFTGQFGDLIADLAIDATTTVGVDLGEGLREVDIKKYIKVEKVPGGQLEDSNVLKGVMINKDIPSELSLRQFASFKYPNPNRLKQCVILRLPKMDSRFTTQKIHCKSLMFALLLLVMMMITILPFAQSNQFCDAGIGYGESICGFDSPYSSKILIKGGTVVNAHHQEVADVYIEDGIIVTVQSNIKVGDGVKIIDATGKYVMPGGIDPHTHLAMEFMGTETVDDYFSGQAAALAGGTTMHIDFVIPVNGSLSAGFDAYVKKAERSCMDYGFHMAITKWDNFVSREMELMVKDKGINSFKFFMAYKGSLMINDELLLEGLKKCKSLGALAMVHAENGDAVFEGQKRMIELGITGPEGHALSRPPMLEGEATGRAIHLAGFVNTPLYIVHVMSIDAMEEIAKARKSGQKVIGEPVVSGLVLDDSVLWDSDFKTAAKFVMSPPIRAPGHGKALQAALSTGILQLVGTDHCTFNSTQKALGIDDFRKIPNGVNGLEERMHLVWDTMVASGQISASDFVRLTSTECARIFNIYPRKGAILVGSDADVIILNPNSSFEISSTTHHSRSDTNVYEGRKGEGKVEVTIAGGKIVWENEELKVVPGSGKYIEMPPYNYLFDGIEKVDLDYLSSLKAPVIRYIQTS